jgi:hypothetical protein
MALIIQPRADYLRIKVRKRHADDALANAQTMVAAIEERGATRVLVVVAESDPIFRVEQYNLSGALERLLKLPGLRIALVSDTAELFASHEYVQFLAAQRGLAVRAFRDESDAVHWLTGARDVGGC